MAGPARGSGLTQIRGQEQTGGGLDLSENVLSVHKILVLKQENADLLEPI